MLAVQSKMARAALSLGVRELAALAEVSPDTIARLERGDILKQSTIDGVKSALEAAGVVFLADGELVAGGPGVRLAAGTDEGKRPEDLNASNDG